MVHPNSLANLKPFSELTEEQQRNIRKKGGQASVEAKRARKTSKEIVEMIATMPIADSKILSKLEKRFAAAEEEYAAPPLEGRFWATADGEEYDIFIEEI